MHNKNKNDQTTYPVAIGPHGWPRRILRDRFVLRTNCIRRVFGPSILEWYPERHSIRVVSTHNHLLPIGYLQSIPWSTEPPNATKQHKTIKTTQAGSFPFVRTKHGKNQCTQHYEATFLHHLPSDRRVGDASTFHTYIGINIGLGPLFRLALVFVEFPKFSNQLKDMIRCSNFGKSQGGVIHHGLRLSQGHVDSFSFIGGTSTFRELVVTPLHVLVVKLLSIPQGLYHHVLIVFRYGRGRIGMMGQPGKVGTHIAMMHGKGLYTQHTIIITSRKEYKGVEKSERVQHMN